MKVEDWIERIEGKISVINDELGEVCERLAALEADMRWVRWLVIAILTGVIALIFKAFAG